jgi:hypothetical protein
MDICDLYLHVYIVCYCQYLGDKRQIQNKIYLVEHIAQV